MGERINEVDKFTQSFIKKLTPPGSVITETEDIFRRRALGAVMEDQAFAKELAPRGTIQSFNLRSDIAKKVIESLGFGSLRVMAMGDIYPPPPVFKDLFQIRNEATYYSEQMIREMGPSGFSYYEIDMCKGHPDAREIMIKNFSDSYGFDSELLNKLIENSYIVSKGGMRCIEIIFSAFPNEAMNENKTVREIAPDNTFQMFWDIVKKVNNNPKTQEHRLDTTQKNGLHLTPEDVDKFYKENPANIKDVMDLWYMIAVGNPSGTSAAPDQIAETCKEIIKHNCGSVIVIDCAYLRTMEDKDAQQVLKLVLNDPEIMKRVIIIDSYSKTHSVPEERTGVIMSANDTLFGTVSNHDKATTQGSPIYHSGLVKALHSRPVDSPNRDRAGMFKDMQRLRRNEVAGLIRFLRSFPELFDDDQSHLGDAKGIYAFLKLRPGVSALDVAAKTGCLGIPFNFKSGTYIRLATGRIMEPTYSKIV